MTDFPIRIESGTPECYVTEGDGSGGADFLFECDSYGAAYSWVADQHDRQENLGLPLSSYSVIPVRSTFGGRDQR